MICAPALHNVIIRKALQHPGNKNEMLLRSEFIIPHYVNARLASPGMQYFLKHSMQAG